MFDFAPRFQMLQGMHADACPAPAFKQPLRQASSIAKAFCIVYNTIRYHCSDGMELSRGGEYTNGLPPITNIRLIKNELALLFIYALKLDKHPLRIRRSLNSFV